MLMYAFKVTHRGTHSLEVFHDKGMYEDEFDRWENTEGATVIKVGVLDMVHII